MSHNLFSFVVFYASSLSLYALSNLGWTEHSFFLVNSFKSEMTKKGVVVRSETSMGVQHSRV